MKNDAIIVENIYKTPILDVYIPSNISNSFKGREREYQDLPKYGEIKDRLPLPYWEGHEDVIELYHKAWEIAFSNLRKSGEGLLNNYIDTAFNDYIFLWDSVFMTMFGHYANHIFCFQNTLNNFYYTQEQDGFIGREINKETGQCRYHRYDPASTGGNLFAWAEIVYYNQFKDEKRLQDVFPVILSYHRWLRMHRTWKDGSYWSCGWACGMDNQMRVSKEVYDYSYHDYRTWVDVCIQQVLSCKCLLEMHELLGSAEDIADIKEEQNHLSTYINEKLWDEETQFYYDADRYGNLDKKKSIGAYWALLAGIMSEQQKEHMIAKLKDEKEFMTKNPIPTMPKSNPHFCEDGNYWRGGVWAPMNYMVLKGLAQNGCDSLAHEIARKHIEHVEKVYKKTGTLWENYCPNKEEQGNPAKPNFVGWTGLSPISIFIEHVLGIQMDFEKRQLIWDINLLEAHGIDNLPYGKDEFLSLHCEKRACPEEEPIVAVTGLQGQTLIVRWNGNEKNVIM